MSEEVITGNVPIPGALTAVDDKHIVAYTGDLYDPYFKMTQAEINKLRDLSANTGFPLLVAASAKVLSSELQEDGSYKITTSKALWVNGDIVGYDIDLTLQGQYCTITGVDDVVFYCTKDIPAQTTIYRVGCTSAGNRQICIVLNYNVMSSITVYKNASPLNMFSEILSQIGSTMKSNNVNFRGLFYKEDGTNIVNDYTTKIESESTTRETADTTMQGEIDELKFTKTIYSAYSELPYQRIFSIPREQSVIFAVSKNVMGRTKTDYLFYSASDYVTDDYFYCNKLQEFYDVRPAPYNANGVSIKANNSKMAPSIQYIFRLIYASCSLDKITWYDDTFLQSTSYVEKNRILAVENTIINPTEETTQVFSTNSAGQYDSFDMASHNDYIIDSSASSGIVSLTAEQFQTDRIYRFSFNQNGTLTLKVTGVKDLSVEVKSGKILSLTPVQVESGYEWYTEEQDVPDSVYTKVEVDNLLSYKANDELVVHKAGDEIITGSKTFQSSQDFQGETTFESKIIFGSSDDANKATITKSADDSTLNVSNALNLGESGQINSTDTRAVDGETVYAYAEDKSKKVQTLTASSTHETYPTSKAVVDYVNSDSTNVVHKTMDETISGTKTFNNQIELNVSGDIDEGQTAAVNGDKVYQYAAEKDHSVITRSSSKLNIGTLADVDNLGTSADPIALQSYVDQYTTDIIITVE